MTPFIQPSVRIGFFNFEIECFAMICERARVLMKKKLKRLKSLCLLLVIPLTLITTAARATLWNMDNNYNIEYVIANNKIRITFQLKNNKTGWMSLAFHEFEFPADTIVAWYDYSENRAYCLDYYNPGIPTMSNFPAPIQDTNPVIKVENGSSTTNINNVQVISSSHANGVTTITCQRNLITNDIFDFQIRRNMQFNVYGAYNNDLGFSEEYNAEQPFRTTYGVTRWIID